MSIMNKEIEEAIKKHIQQYSDGDEHECAICLAYLIGVNQSKPF